MDKGYVIGSLDRIREKLNTGCASLHCVIQRKQQGAGTCRCRPKEIARDLLDLASAIEDNYPHGGRWEGE